MYIIPTPVTASLESYTHKSPSLIPSIVTQSHTQYCHPVSYPVLSPSLIPSIVTQSHTQHCHPVSYPVVTQSHTQHCHPVSYPALSPSLIPSIVTQSHTQHFTQSHTQHCHPVSYPVLSPSLISPSLIPKPLHGLKLLARLVWEHSQWEISQPGLVRKHRRITPSPLLYSVEQKMCDYNF